MFPFDNNSSADQNPPSPPPHLESSLLLKRTPSSSHFQNPNPPPSPLFFSNFPSPFFDEHELPLPQMLAPIDKPQSPAVAGGKSRRRPAGKKDRHSKIRTAHGVRDRRMRLSLQVARKFFDIQDMLGFDKASSTIEWLFTKSKHAIRDLVIASKRKNDELPFDFSDSFSSECEAMSGVAHEMMIVSSEKSDELLGQDSANRAKNKSRRIIRPSDRARESRERARARARWRTREKMMFKKWNERNNIDQDLDRKLGFSIDQEFSGNYSLLLGQDRDAGTIEKLLGNSSLSSASNIISPISDNNNNNNDSYRSCVDPSGNLMGFVGDWEMLSNVTNQQGNSNDNSVITTHNFPLLFPQ